MPRFKYGRDAARHCLPLYRRIFRSRPDSTHRLRDYCYPLHSGYPVEHSIPSPLLCLVLQGRKRVSVGDRELYFAAGDSMLITSNRPMSSQIVQASLHAPYLSIALDLDLCVIADLVLEMEAQGLGFDLLENATTDDEVANTALRLMQLLDRPTALRLLQNNCSARFISGC